MRRWLTGTSLPWVVIVAVVIGAGVGVLTELRGEDGSPPDLDVSVQGKVLETVESTLPNGRDLAAPNE